MSNFIPIANANDLAAKKTVKSSNQKAIESAEKAGFPNCKGLYPDCPEKPDKNHKMCRTCPVLDKEE